MRQQIRANTHTYTRDSYSNHACHGLIIIIIKNGEKTKPLVASMVSLCWFIVSEASSLVRSMARNFAIYIFQVDRHSVNVSTCI